MENLNELESRARAIGADVNQMQLNAERTEAATLLAELRAVLNRLGGLIADLERARGSLDAPKIDRRVIREVIAPELDLHRARQGR